MTPNSKKQHLFLRLETEKKTQALWHPRQPEKVTPLMERMLRADYMDPQRTSAREARRLAKLLNYAIQQVPFYRNHHQWAAADLVTEQSGKELLEQLPEYLITYPPSLEALVYAAQGLPVDSLRALRVIGATLTPGMRHRIESATGITVQENYGLNEIGLIANRDPPVTAARKL